MNAEGKVIPLRRPPADVPMPDEQMSDQALVAACAVGDSTALGVLFDRHHRAVYAFLSRLRGTDERDLDDLVQATFLEALRSAKRFRGDAPVNRWLFGIAVHVVSHHVRSEIRRKSFHTRLADHPRRAPTEPAARVERDQILAKVRRAIDDLPDKQRTVYVMCELEEIPGVEAARILGMREGTVWRLLHQARTALRDALERREP
ncbi:MAG TPA: RNA polymerase sigma factor [Kofleriaceae bacterium]|nr:RNA polymerase sigma factor [Kofleriaceae bacterium]